MPALTGISDEAMGVPAWSPMMTLKFLLFIRFPAASRTMPWMVNSCTVRREVCSLAASEGLLIAAILPKEPVDGEVENEVVETTFWSAIATGNRIMINSI